MSLGLVARSARSLSDHLNRYYRVLKGIDPDTVEVRLPSGGRFAVLHSATAAQLFRVTDAGIHMADGSINGAMIADGTITGPDIANSTITPDKLTGLSGVPAGAITTTEIQDRTIQAVDIALGAVTANEIAADAITQKVRVIGASSGPSIGPGAASNLHEMVITMTTTGGPVLALFSGAFSINPAANVGTVSLYLNTVLVPGTARNIHGPGNSYNFPMQVMHLFTGLSAGTHTVQVFWQINGGTFTAVALDRELILVELKR